MEPSAAPTNLPSSNPTLSTPSPTSYMTTTTTTKTPLKIPSDVIDLQCGASNVTGDVADCETIVFEFKNAGPRWVTFSTCYSNFDTALFLADSTGKWIQQKSTNKCDGDDCTDEAIPCPNEFKETFTIWLSPATYYLMLGAEPVERQGGKYEITA